VTYFDTSLLVAFYANENSALEAARLLASGGHPVPFNRILELELRNAIRRKVPRKEASTAQVRPATQADREHASLSVHEVV